MMVSTLVDSTPVNRAGRSDTAGSYDPTRFSECTLGTAPHLLQSNLINENPFCRLAQRTSEGAAICNKGCGLSDPSGVCSHTCPFGLRMMRVKTPMGTSGMTRWVGRRFPSVDAMHNALDSLLALGLDEDTILAHLPPNPIAGDGELAAAAHAESIIEAPLVQPVRHNIPAVHGEPEAIRPAEAELAVNAEDHILNMLEYVEQIQALLATAGQPAAVCERFLRVLTGMVPFSEMSIYLRDAESGQLVIAASVDLNPRRTRPLAHDCRLGSDSVGAQALEQRRMMFEQNGVVEPISACMNGSGTLAIPLPLRPGQALGVWLARRGKDQYPSRLGSDPVRVMRLLVSILTMRLQQLVSLPVSEEATESIKSDREVPASSLQWDREALLGVLNAEIERAVATGTRLALLSLHITSRDSGALQTVREIELAMRDVLRVYDQIAIDGAMSNAWAIVLPLADERIAIRLAARLIEAVEDQLDACGGAEEQGLRPAVGISIFGQDAGDASQMIEHAGVALKMADQDGLEEPIHTWVDALDASEKLERADHA